MLAIDRNDIGRIIAQGLEPGGKEGLEQVRIERIDHIIESIVRRDAVHEGQKTALMQP